VTRSRRAFLVGAGAAAAVAACSAKARPSAGPATSPTTSATNPATTTTPAPQGPAAFISHGPSTSTGVALTFHTAGDPTITETLLTDASNLGCKLTFFVVGTWLAANAPLVARLVAAGHELGNHTWSHINLPALPAQAMHDEIAKCADELTRQTGSISKWFRPSQTDVPTAAILEQAGKVGYATSVGYDVDPLDYTNPGEALVLSRTRARIQPGSIVSLHTLYSGTPAAFGGIVAAIRAKGLEPVTVSSVLG
jgi:peptidoglycan/xylan/chitin deacetylase (PgdA/CDA1 family)